MFSKRAFLSCLIPIAAACALLGARWHLIETRGSPVPHYDQWAAEGLVVCQAEAQGTVGLANFIYPHNEHHIVPTRLLMWALLHWNGQWDVRTQMTVNAVLAAVLMVFLLTLARPWLSPVGLALMAAGLAWLQALPVFYENPLWGFQSQFYFLTLFSLGQLRLMLTRPLGSVGWCLGVVAGVSAAASMGSGIMASAIVAILAAWRGWQEPAARRRWWVTALAAMVLLGVGAWWLPPLPPTLHHFEFAASAHTFFHALSFPAREFSWLWLLFWLPGILFAASVLRRRAVLAPGELMLLASGGWVLLQVAALACARPETGPVLANRYYDILAVGLVANFSAFAWAWSHWQIGARRRWQQALAASLPLLWLGCAGTKALATARVNRDLIEGFVGLREEHIERLSAFVYTNDPSHLTSVSHPHVPVDDPKWLVEYLRMPTLRSVLPVELRAPISLVFPEGPGQPSLNNALPVFVPNETGRLHRGTFFAGSGAAGRIDVTSTSATKAARSRLRFKVAGDLRRGETELRINDANGRVAAVITDRKLDTLTWIEVEVPGRSFSVEVVDRSSDGWLAFIEPVEIGPLSHWTLVVLRQSQRLQWLGIGGLGLLLVVALRVDLRQRKTSSSIA